MKVTKRMKKGAEIFLIVLGVTGSVVLPRVAVWGLSAWDSKLKEALKIGCEKDCSVAALEAAHLYTTKKSDLTALADFWLKLRNSAEQRVDWFYVALLAGLAALMSGYDKLKEELRTGRILLIALGLGGTVAGSSIAYATIYDVAKINLIGLILGCSEFAKLPGAESGRYLIGEYLMGPGIAQGAFSAGIVFLCLMLLFALWLAPPRSG